MTFAAMRRVKVRVMNRDMSSSTNNNSTPRFSSTKLFTVPEYIADKDSGGIGVTRIALEQRNLLIDYQASADMKGQIKILVTGNWEADQQQIRNKADKKGFMSESTDLLIRAVVEAVYSNEEGAQMIA